MRSQMEGTSDIVGDMPEQSVKPRGVFNTSSPLYAAPPSTPTPIAEIVAALREIDRLHGLTDQEFYWLAANGTERVATERVIVFRENEPAHHLNLVLRGEIYVHRRNSASVSLFIGRTGQITGKLPYSRMKTWGGEGSSSGSLWILDIHEDNFSAMLSAIPSMAQLCVSIMLDRVRDFTRTDLQAEKLVSLGKLAANLSHELNNPASAAQRAAIGLSSKVDRIQELCTLGRMFASDEEAEHYLDWTAKATATLISDNVPEITAEDSLSESDCAERLIEWLEAHQVPAAWTMAPALARANVSIGLLDDLASKISPHVLPAALSSFSISLNSRSMLEAIAVSSGRIFSIISAIKDYSYMDQAPIQQVDLVQSIDNTLALLQSRMQHMVVLRNYDADLPPVTGYGAELSQVWTALIENALDATKGHGTLRISAGLKGEMAFVEIWDDGIGIDPALSSRIFEPFFTTKPLGQGLGLGLDTVRRIVSKHFGSVSVQSSSGATCFQVRLPLDQPLIY